MTPMTRLWFACLFCIASLTASAQGAEPGPETTFRGAYFEIRHPADFKARPVGPAPSGKPDAATFTSPDGAMEFYVFSPKWGGDAPGVALVPATEVETARQTGKGKSSGVDGVYTWITIMARDKSYTRSLQDFTAADGSIHWVIGMKYRGDAALQQHKTRYARFKASLKQFAD